MGSTPCRGAPGGLAALAPGAEARAARAARAARGARAEPARPAAPGRHAAQLPAGEPEEEPRQDLREKTTKRSAPPVLVWRRSDASGNHNLLHQGTPLHATEPRWGSRGTLRMLVPQCDRAKLREKGAEHQNVFRHARKRARGSHGLIEEPPGPSNIECVSVGWGSGACAMEWSPSSTRAHGVRRSTRRKPASGAAGQARSAGSNHANMAPLCAEWPLGMPHWHKHDAGRGD